MGRAAEHKVDDLGNVTGGQGLVPLIDTGGPRFIPLETDLAELCLDKPRIHGPDADPVFVAELFALGRDLILRMRDEAGAAGAGFLLVTATPAIAASLEGTAVDVVFLDESIDNVRLSLPEAGHKNEAGHGIKAWEIARALNERGLIPESHRHWRDD